MAGQLRRPVRNSMIEKLEMNYRLSLSFVADEMDMLKMISMTSHRKGKCSLTQPKSD